MTVASSRYLLRSMTLADIPRVSEIERESFPSMWPQTAYKRELQRNNLAAYLVLCELPSPGPSLTMTGDSVAGSSSAETVSSASALRRVGRWAHGLLHRDEAALEVIPSGLTPSPSMPSGPMREQRIVGFVGIWFMVDEAHIVTIAVAEAERRQGLGEALLIAAIELAQRRSQDLVTLECRVSNTGAQALYEKYAFRRVGVRKRYYTDNNEDALIMTTPPIQSPEYARRFEELRAEHRARRGAPRVDHPEL